jgi:glutamate dehydrogenase
MPTQPEQAKAEILQEIIASIHEKVPEERRDQVEAFTRQYYQRLAPEDLLELEPEDLYGAALAHLRLAQRRQPGETKVRVYSPRFEEHGWRSKHSIVEIVTDDMPFLVDSVAMELNRHGLVIHLPIHPVISVRRNDAGELVEVLASGEADGIEESFLHFEVDRQSEPEVLDRLRAEIERVLEDVRAAVEDWAAMREQVHHILEEFGQRPPPVDEAELAEARALLEWIDDHHFTFLGYRAYDLVQEDGEDVLRPVQGTGLGILR